VNQPVILPRRTNAASYSGQFVTRYLAFGILWRRLSLNLYGMGLRGHEIRTTHLCYGPAPRLATRPPGLPLVPGPRRDASRSYAAGATTRFHKLRCIRAPKRRRSSETIYRGSDEMLTMPCGSPGIIVIAERWCASFPATPAARMCNPGHGFVPSRRRSKRPSRMGLLYRAGFTW